MAGTPERTRAADVGGRIGERVRLCGWVDGSAASMLRDRSGTVTLRDGSGSVRVSVADDGGLPPPESAVEVVGTVTAAGVEAAQVRVVGPVLADLPIDGSSPLESRLDWRFLDLRRPRNRLIFEVQTTAEAAMREYWAARGFLELHSPKLRSNPNRSGRELFPVPYFDQQAYLVQSPQFYKQMAMAAGFEAVFEIGPVFRANPNVTARHDTEFTSVDVEMSWIDSHEDVMAFEEAWLRHVIAAVEARHGRDITRLFGVIVEVPAVPFPRVPLDRGRALVASAAPGQPPGDLDPAGEKALGVYVRERWGHDFVFVTEYPAATRPFYHMRFSEGSALTRGFDLLWKGMEVTTGAQREHRYDVLVGQAEARGVPLEPIRYYLDCFRFGCPPHGGFGLGLTRMLMCLLGIDNVREATFLYRGVDRLSP
ncbi:MAG: aspartate--tRNA(Asn) ligase [Acidimicrobiales bacterium]